MKNISMRVTALVMPYVLDLLTIHSQQLAS